MSPFTEEQRCEIQEIVNKEVEKIAKNMITRAAYWVNREVYGDRYASPDDVIETVARRITRDVIEWVNK